MAGFRHAAWILFASAGMAAPLAGRPAARPVADAARRAQPPEEDDEAAEREAVARRTIAEDCLICHDESMITRQRLTSAQWAAELEKMVGWGAPLPAEARGPLHEYLARRYSERTPLPPPPRRTLAEIDSPERGSATRPLDGDSPARDAGAALYATNCANCHGPEALGAELGPSLVGKAVLGHPDAYRQVVRKGLRRMPGFERALSTDQEEAIFQWLRGRRYP